MEQQNKQEIEVLRSQLRRLEEMLELTKSAGQKEILRLAQDHDIKEERLERLNKDLSDENALCASKIADLQHEVDQKDE